MSKHSFLAQILREGTIKRNLSRPEIIENIILNKEGEFTKTGAIKVNTGKFTGRAPRDRFFVHDDLSKGDIHWSDVNQALSEEHFELLRSTMAAKFTAQKIFINEVYAMAADNMHVKVTVLSTKAYGALFTENMFMQEPVAGSKCVGDIYIAFDPDFKAESTLYGINNSNFTAINLKDSFILIGGTGYSGEIKKSVFTFLNYHLLRNFDILPMHCSAVVNELDNVNLFFGLSGTGKTTLSSGIGQKMIGDDEHGWSSEGVFNFEGGCYAKILGISDKSEPQIYNAIHFGALVENAVLFEEDKDIDFENDSITQNSRVSYDRTHLKDIVQPANGPHPTDIFLLTMDANGILPPIALLNEDQAFYHFLSGYTSKVAGTEEGVTEPEAVFSACFGEAFLPLSPVVYARKLRELIRQHGIRVWLINTGYVNGAYGTGNRIPLTITRRLIEKAQSGEILEDNCIIDPVFGFKVPVSLEGIPTEILHPRQSWEDKFLFDYKANQLVNAFLMNFERFHLPEEEYFYGVPKLELSLL